MEHAVRVDADTVAAAAAALAQVHDDLERAGGVLAQALRGVTAAVGPGVLAAAAEAAAGQWQGGMVDLAEQGRQLGRATLEAAELYRVAEVSALRAWGLLAPGAGP